MITRGQAEQALACIREQFKFYIDAGYAGPALVENWKPFVYQGRKVIDTNAYDYAIVWDEGPFEWAYRAKSGGIDEELTPEGREFDKDYVARTPEAQGWPEGVGESPYFPNVLTLHED